MNPQELVSDIKEIKRVLAALEKRAEPATAKQLEAINQRPVVINPAAFAAHVSKALAQALAADQPNTEGIATAAEASAQAILEAATIASRQIAQSGAAAAGEIRGAARQRVNEVAQLIGFTSWKAALIVGLIPLLTGAGLFYFYQKSEHQRTELAGWKSFGLWVSEKYPEVRKAYDRSSQ